MHITGYVDVPPNNETALKIAASINPVAIAIEADKMGFQFYRSGVYDGECGEELDHGVLLVRLENGILENDSSFSTTTLVYNHLFGTLSHILALISKVEVRNWTTRKVPIAQLDILHSFLLCTHQLPVLICV